MFHSFHNCCQSFLFSYRNKLGLKRHMKKNAKMQDICNKETKTTAASLHCRLHYAAWLAYIPVGISMQTTVSVKIFNRNPLNYKWTHPIDKAGHVH